MNGIIGKKIGMTQIFDLKGNLVPITVVRAGPCYVVQVKNAKRDGYDAVQLGFEKIPERKVNKPLNGIFRAARLDPLRVLQEFPIEDGDKYDVGGELKVDIFKAGDKVKVTGTSKGKGFAGVVKRHGFKGGPKTHGQSDRWRAPGSVGGSSFPARVFKGTRMPGRMGNQKVTVKNVEVIGVDEGTNLLFLSGAVPGARNSYVSIRK